MTYVLGAVAWLLATGKSRAYAPRLQATRLQFRFIKNIVIQQRRYLRTIAGDSVLIVDRLSPTKLNQSVK